MTGSHLVDSDVLVPLLNGDTSVAELLAQRRCYLSVIVLGELRFGASNSDHEDANQARVDNLAAAMPLLGIDAATSRIYGRLRAEQRRKGKPIPKNDLWIAAQAMQRDLTVLAIDKHYDSVDGLKLEHPVGPS